MCVNVRNVVAFQKEEHPMTIQPAAQRGIEFIVRLSSDEYEALAFLIEQRRQEYASQGGFRGAITFSTVVGQSLLQAVAAERKEPAQTQPQQSWTVQPPPLPRMPELPTSKNRTAHEANDGGSKQPYVLLKPRPEDLEPDELSGERAIRYGRRPSMPEVHVRPMVSGEYRR